MGQRVIRFGPHFRQPQTADNAQPIPGVGRLHHRSTRSHSDSQHYLDRNTEAALQWDLYDQLTSVFRFIVLVTLTPKRQSP